MIRKIIKKIRIKIIKKKKPKKCQALIHQKTKKEYLI